MDIKYFAYQQRILSNVKTNLEDLNNRKAMLLNELIKIEKQINKHKELRDKIKDELEEN